MAKNSQRKEILQLLKRAKDGEGVAFEALLVQYSPLIDSLVSARLGPELYSLYADDFRQEAVMVFYNAILAYDMEQFEVEFGLYAKICITNALISQFRLLKKRDAEMLSGVSDGYLFASNTEDPSEKYLDEERLRKLYSVIRENLSEFEYKVWWLHVCGKTGTQIAEELSRDKKSIDNAICRIRKKLGALLKPNE